MAEYNFEGDDFLEAASVPAPASGADASAAESAETADTAPEPVAEEQAATTPPVVPAADPQQAATTVSPEVSQLLARERLAAVPGETNDAALRRLYDHQRQRADRLYYEEVRGARSEARKANEALEAFKRSMDPLIRAFNERTQQVEQELRQSQIPEQGTPEYLVWQQQQILAKLEEREKREAEERQLAEETAAQESLLIEDEAADAELESVIAADADARAAYEFATQLGLRAAARAYPNATAEQIQEVVRLSQVLDMRAARRSGVSVGDLYKQRRADVRQLMGLATETPQPVATPATAPAAPAKPAANGAAKTGSPTARNLSAAKAQAAARAVVSPTPQAAAAPTNDAIDFSQMDEESLLEFTLANPENAAEYSRWISEKFGKASWR